MGRLQHLALILIVAFALGACGPDRVAPLSSGSSVPPTAPAPSPTAAATVPVASASGVPASARASEPLPSESTAVVAYSSKRFGYAVDYPAGWVVRPATNDWPSNGFPEPEGTTVDRFAPAPDSPTWMFVSSVLLADGKTAAGVPVKAKDMDDVRIGEIDSELPLMCQVSEKVPVTVDGIAGRRQDLAGCFQRDYLIEVLVSNDVRLYMIAVLNPGPIDAPTRARFDRFVNAFRIRT
ncbi:MAG TPA: hypothetical protein VM427_03910 [Patescibacteria group bacterium]|nr:hypothetical protein [Patescibacteria group bacterium]